MDLKKLSLEDLRALAEDIRQTILSACLKNGGHLGASLGTVELAIALHTVFKSPQEPLVWDVGHQAYAHKILTGRGEQFGSLRRLGGLSGFLSRAESPHDVFGAGHSSTSISAALSMAWARRETKDWTVAIIGDGGLTAGLSFEALNNVRTSQLGPLLIVVNDNQMSISPNVGAVSSILAGGKAKDFFSLFEFEYLGPIDGHNLEELIGTLRGVRESGTSAPIVLHALTQKGKGYAPAEENPGGFHGVSPLQEKVSALPRAPKQKSLSEAFGEAICKLAAEDPRLVAITAAMAEGTGLFDFSHKFPERFFDVGIAEPHAVTFAAGLATQGFRPVVAIYSTFLQRALDSVIHDVAIQKLPVIFAVDRAGIVGADGPTHHGVFDLTYLGMIPGITIFAPETIADIENCLRLALQSSGPVAIRYPRGSGPASAEQALQPDGARWKLKCANPKLIIASVGVASRRVGVAIENIISTTPDLAGAISWASVVSVKPIPHSLQQAVSGNPQAKLLCVEDSAIHGGFGQQLGADEIVGYADHFIQHGSVAELEEIEGISSSAIEKKIRALLNSK